MKEIFEYSIAKFGCGVTLTNSSGSVTVKAFLQPITSSDRRYYKELVTQAGIASPMRYLYLGPADKNVEGYSSITSRGSSYAVVSSETLMAGATPVCCWAILRKVASA